MKGLTLWTWRHAPLTVPYYTVEHDAHMTVFPHGHRVWHIWRRYWGKVCNNKLQKQISWLSVFYVKIQKVLLSMTEVKLTQFDFNSFDSESVPLQMNHFFCSCVNNFVRRLIVTDFHSTIKSLSTSMKALYQDSCSN